MFVPFLVCIGATPASRPATTAETPCCRAQTECSWKRKIFLGGIGLIAFWVMPNTRGKRASHAPQWGTSRGKEQRLDKIWPVLCLLLFQSTKWLSRTFPANTFQLHTNDFASSRLSYQAIWSFSKAPRILNGLHSPDIENRTQSQASVDWAKIHKYHIDYGVSILRLILTPILHQQWLCYIHSVNWSLIYSKTGCDPGLNLPLICAGFLCQEHLEDPGILPNIPSCCNFIREVSLLEILPPSLELSCTALTLTQWRKRTLTQTCLCPWSVSSAFRAQVFRCSF